MGFEKSYDGKYISKVTKYSLLLAGAWTLIVAISLGLGYRRESEEARNAAILNAQAQFSEDVIALRWNANHGGVYVPITDSTPPNPYLSHIPDRDVETSAGLRLTLVNPAYMTRQIHELDWKTQGVYSHITSLNPIRPENGADPWEKRALESLEEGAPEFSSIEAMNGEPYLRHMQPLVTEQACLKCHAQQGYKLGDVHDGISVSVPMASYLTIARQDLIEATASHAALWFLGLVVLAFGTRRIRWHIVERNRAEAASRESETLLNEVGDVAKIGGWEMDLVTRKARWTQATYDIVEIEPGQAIPGPDEHIEYYLPQYRSMISEAMRALFEDNQPLDFEAEALTAKGNVKWFRALGRADWTDGKCVRAYGTLQDITKQKQAEAALRESEERFKALYDNAPLSYQSLDADGRFLDVNPCWLKALGYEREEVIGAGFADFLHPDWKPHFETNFPEFKKRGHVHGVQFRTRHKDGHYLDVQFEGRVVYWPNGSFRQTCCVFQDITDRKRAEEALRESEERYRVTAKQTGQMVYDYDLGTGQIRWLGAIEEMTGHSAMEFSEVNIAEWSVKVHPDDRKEILVVLDESRKRCGTFDATYRFRRKDGTYIHVEEHGVFLPDEQGQACRMLGTMSDITVRKQAEDALRQSEAHLRTLIKTIPDLVWVKDPDGVYLVCNPRFGELYGAREAGIIGKTDHDFVGEELAAFFRANDLAAMACGKPRMNEEDLTFADGHKETLETIKTPLVDSEGNLIGVLGVGRDITERKRAEGALRDSMMQYEQLFHGMIDGFALHEIICDESGKPVDYRFLAVNPAFVRLTGLRARDVIGKLAYEVIPGLEPVWGERYGSVALTGKAIHFEDYSAPLEKYFEVTAYRPAEGQFACIFVDVTERRRAEEALQESQQKLLEAQRIAQLGHYVLFAETGHWTCSPELDTIFGIDEFYQRDVAGWLQIVHPDHREIMSNYLRNYVLDQRQKFDKEYKIVDMTSGQEKWVHGLGNLKLDEDGNPVEMFGTIQDVTERRQAEEALRESEEKFRQYVSHAPGGIFIADGQGRYVDVNEAACKMTGYSKSELLNMSLFELADPETPPEGFESFSRLKTTGQVNSEISLRCKDGRTIWVSLDAVALSEDRFMAFCSDISETKRLRELESRAARLETAGTIAGQVAHDFNNLLAPMIAYPEFIHEELPHDHKAHAYLDAIETAAAKMAVINQDLLTMGRRGHYNQEIIDLNRVVLQAAQEMESRTNTVTIEADLCAELMRIKGGAAQIHRMITNLLVNAQDAMDDIGQIIVRTENYYADDISIAFGRVPKGEFVKLTISDNGCGIPNDIIQKIIDPFFSTKTTDKKRGSGLGLSVVDAVMKDHSGFLDLSSSVGQGTSFFLYFPITREDVGEGGPESLAGGTETVLIVDDDDVQRDVSARLLTRLGYAVSSVVSGEIAVEHVRENPPDLIVLDMVMPGGIDGTETYRRILGINPHQKAILLSGFSESDRVLEAQRLGAGAFVRKPITKVAIASAVRTELDRRVETPAP